MNQSIVGEVKFGCLHLVMGICASLSNNLVIKKFLIIHRSNPNLYKAIHVVQHSHI